MLLTISGEIMCGGHQRTLSNRRLPSSQSKPTAVDRQKDYSINYGKRLPERPKSNKKEKKLNKESVRCLHVVSPKPAFACKHACACAPVNKTDHQCWTATHVDTVNSTRPHELRAISVVLDAKLAHAQWPPSRSHVPTNAPINGVGGSPPPFLLSLFLSWLDCYFLLCLVDYVSFTVKSQIFVRYLISYFWKKCEIWMKIYFCLEAIEFQCNFVLRPSKVRKLVRTNQFQVKSTKMGTGRKFVTLQYSVNGINNAFRTSRHKTGKEWERNVSPSPGLHQSQIWCACTSVGSGLL